MNNQNNNNDVLLIAPAPSAAGDIGVIGGADGPTAIITTSSVGVAENLGASVEILGQGMASIFVVLGLIAVVVAVMKKLDNKKK